MTTSFGWEGEGRYMAHSDCGWTCGCVCKTVGSLENTCHTWALLWWWFTTKRRYIKCMHLYLHRLGFRNGHATTTSKNRATKKHPEKRPRVRNGISGIRVPLEEDWDDGSGQNWTGKVAVATPCHWVGWVVGRGRPCPLQGPSRIPSKKL